MCFYRHQVLSWFCFYIKFVVRKLCPRVMPKDFDIDHCVIVHDWCQSQNSRNIWSRKCTWKWCVTVAFVEASTFVWNSFPKCQNCQLSRQGNDFWPVWVNLKDTIDEWLSNYLWSLDEKVDHWGDVSQRDEVVCAISTGFDPKWTDKMVTQYDNWKEQHVTFVSSIFAYEITYSRVLNYCQKRCKPFLLQIKLSA